MRTTPENRQIFALVLLAAVSVAAAQDQAKPLTPAQSSEVAPAVDDQRAPAPALLTGDASSLSFSSELERSNILRGGLAVQATYDDNAANNATRIGDFGYSILPFIQLDQTRSRLHWTLGYFGGLTVNQRLSSRNQGSHDLNGSLQYRLSPHVDLRLSDSFLDTTGFLQQFQNGLGTPVTGPINQPNQTLVTPLAKSLNNTGAVDMSYQYGAGDVIGGGGTFYDAHFKDVPTGSTQLVDTTTRSGDFYYNHRFTERNWTSITYKFQRLTFSPIGNEVIDHSLLLSHTITIQQHLTLSMFAGPDYSEIDALSGGSPSEHQLSASGGTSLGWQGQFTSLRLGATRQVSDGGGLSGAVTVTSVNGGVRRQLARSTTVYLTAIYGHNRELGRAVAGNPPLKSATGTVGLEQKLAANFMLRLDYSRDYLEGGTVSSSGSVNHNRGSISISYNFTRPLGR